MVHGYFHNVYSLDCYLLIHYGLDGKLLILLLLKKSVSLKFGNGSRMTLCH